MQVHQVQAGWQQYAIMAAVTVIVFAIRGRSLMRVRPLKVEQLWIVPAIYAAVVAYLFVKTPPTLAGWGVAALALVVGGAIGWQRGKTMRIHLDPATGTLMQKGSIWALAIIVVLVALKMVAQAEGQALHFNVAVLIDGLAALTLGIFAAQRLEMYLRAKRLLEGAPA
ncbi:DUF1453 domain-containing protein [Sphingomonas sp. RB3P16]|uniref:DUF1453 domain-containing protein n=1 Tax=Parasphingomonas frigoris TaxID=3096163 RepID=UPI002FC921EF